MVEILYIAKDEERPSGEKSFLIECRNGGGADSFIQDSLGVTIRIRSEELEAIIADLERKGATKVYVRRPADA
jgi:hypothetical protein